MSAEAEAPTKFDPNNDPAKGLFDYGSQVLDANSHECFAIPNSFASW